MFPIMSCSFPLSAFICSSCLGIASHRIASSLSSRLRRYPHATHPAAYFMHYGCIALHLRGIYKGRLLLVALISSGLFSSGSLHLSFSLPPSSLSPSSFPPFVSLSPSLSSCSIPWFPRTKNHIYSSYSLPSVLSSPTHLLHHLPHHLPHHLHSFPHNLHLCIFSVQHNIRRHRIFSFFPVPKKKGGV